MMSGGALLLGDARLPTGGHTQSAGLEPALLTGLSPASIPGFIVSRLRTCVRVDAGTAVVGLRLLYAGAPLDPVVDAWCARTPSEVVQAASIEAGRGYLRLHQRLTGFATATPALPRPLAVAALAHSWDLSAAELARIICHDDVQSVCSAALKLTPCDPVDTVSWAVAAGDEADRVVTEVQGLDDPDDIPAAAAPEMELWQHAHGNASRRLFRA
ncbi:urease accessory protein UreF [Flexivirga caeni]|uniref:Urease accessory protein UreF n=1 Tax=Flexivirga caeni TaxID=2294115 RepID=A0A3M9M7Y0_9MICO|nr:urease accessory UreF family protein [Flexivirga caeni]RNI21674.1 urease accessory protein UreF [Flexivirga caeni]